MCEAATYTLGVDGANACPDGSSKIGSEDECKSAGVVLGHPWDKAVKADSEPGGCYRNKGKKILYNSAAGAAKARNAPICKQVCSSCHLLQAYSTTEEQLEEAEEQE